MREGLDERAGQLDRVVKDYAWWNEAVEAIQLRQDRAWAEARLGSYLYGTHEYDWAFVIAPDGSTFIAALEGETVTEDISTALGNEHWRLLVEQSRAAITGGRARSQCTPYLPMRDGQLGIASATAIMAETSWAGARPAGAPYVLVVVRSLTAGVVGGAGRRARPRASSSSASSADEPVDRAAARRDPTALAGRQRVLAGASAGHRVSGRAGAFAGRGAAAVRGLRLVGAAAEPSLDRGHRRERGPVSRRRRRELGLDLRDRRRGAADLDLGAVHRADRHPARRHRGPADHRAAAADGRRGPVGRAGRGACASIGCSAASPAAISTWKAGRAPCGCPASPTATPPGGMSAGAAPPPTSRSRSRHARPPSS